MTDAVFSVDCASAWIATLNSAMCAYFERQIMHLNYRDARLILKNMMRLLKFHFEACKII